MPMPASHRFALLDESNVGEARRHIRALAQRMDPNPVFHERCALVATEMAYNVIRHGQGGELILRTSREGPQDTLELLALDLGKGMANVAECLRDGYSTHGTAGTGLGAIQRQSNAFEIYSRVAAGTAVWVSLSPTPKVATPSSFQIGAVNVPFQGEPVSGDAWGVMETPGNLRILLADGLGHGQFAHEASELAVRVFREMPAGSPATALERIHQALQSTRGSAAMIVELHTGLGQAISSGVGNVAARLGPADRLKSLVSDNGTLGAVIRKTRDLTTSWSPDMLLILHTDGIGTQWTLDKYPGLAQRHPALVAGVLYRDFRRRNDDATVVVVRYQP